MAEQAKIVTGIGKAELHRILVRGYDLNKELVGKITFTDMTSLILRGRLPTPNEAKMLDSLLVILVEHGMVDQVVARGDIPEKLGSILKTLMMGRERLSSAA